MQSLKNILVPIHEEDQEYTALKAAVQLAKKFECLIHLYGTIPSAKYNAPLHPKEAVLGLTNERIEDQLQQLRMEEYNRLYEVMEKHVPEFYRGNHVVDLKPLDEEMSKVLSDDELSIDLIVSDRNYELKVFDFFKGSKLDRIIRSSEVPVLVVSSANDLNHIRSILIPTDLKTEVPKSALRFAKFISDYDCEINFTYIVGNEVVQVNEILKGVAEIAEKAEISTYSTNVKYNANPVEGIKDIARQLDVDMILMKSYAKSSLSAFFSENKAENTLHELESIPFLVEKVTSVD